MLRRVENAGEMVARRQNRSEKLNAALKNLKREANSHEIFSTHVIPSKDENFGETNLNIYNYIIYY